jgi:hypothetical protein
LLFWRDVAAKQRWEGKFGNFAFVLWEGKIDKLHVHTGISHVAGKTSLQLAHWAGSGGAPAAHCVLIALPIARIHSTHSPFDWNCSTRRMLGVLLDAVLGVLLPVFLDEVDTVSTPWTCKTFSE